MRSLGLTTRADVVEVFGAILGRNRLGKSGVLGDGLWYTSDELMIFLGEGHAGDELLVKGDPRDISYAVAVHAGTKRRFILRLAADERTRALYAGRPRCWKKAVREDAARRKKAGGRIRTSDLMQADADLSAQIDARTGARERSAAQTRLARQVKRDLARKPVDRHRRDDTVSDLFEYSHEHREVAPAAGIHDEGIGQKLDAPSGNAPTRCVFKKRFSRNRTVGDMS